MDFEASSLAKGSFPIEVAWVLPSGQGETYLIKPMPDWTEWSVTSEKVHGIKHRELLDHGFSCAVVAKRIQVIGKTYQFVVSAPAWDGMWLNMLLRAGGEDSISVLSDDLAYFNACSAMMELMTGETGSPEFHRSQREIAEAMQDLIGSVEEQEELKGKPAHRALADAQAMWTMWRTVTDKAREYVALKKTHPSKLY
jgi:hypothetical protein